MLDSYITQIKVWHNNDNTLNYCALFITIRVQQLQIYCVSTLYCVKDLLYYLLNRPIVVHIPNTPWKDKEFIWWWCSFDKILNCVTNECSTECGFPSSIFKSMANPNVRLFRNYSTQDSFFSHGVLLFYVHYLQSRKYLDLKLFGICYNLSIREQFKLLMKPYDDQQLYFS
jgi:hypothetical protein